MTESQTKEQIQNIINRYLLRNAPQPAGVRSIAESVAIGTDIGGHRTENQDRVLLAYRLNADNSETFSIILCDGMGGMESGAQCASLSIAIFIARLFFYDSVNTTLSSRLDFSVREADRIVFSNHFGKGGATLSSVTFDTKYGFCGVNVGDSRIYACEFDKVNQLTTDDTLAGIRKDKTSYFPDDKNLLQFIGMGKDINPHIIEINSNDNISSFLITSDGSHFVGDDALAKIVVNSKKSETVVRRLIELSRMYGGSDNSSIAFMQISSDFKQQLNPDRDVLYIFTPYSELQIVCCPDRKIKDENMDCKPNIDINTQPKKKSRKQKNKPDKKLTPTIEISFGDSNG
ncbi:PP2C family protein-serine/threonine phosphatase [Desulfovibrio cuneatus]|uniref:PP2C family protein-serine/threonine phosphatase n=1 Tax=Desulfovibrio cuneatus TaxID=159728 RepID=UPI00041E5D0B|nr:hypothetical protein [Desulfovibrio cuneatus]